MLTIFCSFVAMMVAMYVCYPHTTPTPTCVPTHTHHAHSHDVNTPVVGFPDTKYRQSAPGLETIRFLLLTCLVVMQPCIGECRCYCVCRCVGGGVGGWGGRCCVVCSCNIAAVCALMCWADVSVLMRCKECGRA